MDRNFFFFLDETGILNKPSERFFALGTLATPKPQNLYLAIQKIRDYTGFYDEVKWKTLSNKKLPLIKDILNLFVQDTNSFFACVVLDRDRLDYQKYFQNNFWKVYESFTVHLIRGSLQRGNRAILLADFYPSPGDVNFEEKVRLRVNKGFRREAVLGVCRIDSKASDVLQLTDLLLGAVSYDYKLENKLISKPSKIKKELLAYLKKQLKIKNFTQPFRRKKFKVMEFKREIR